MRFIRPSRSGCSGPSPSTRRPECPPTKSSVCRRTSPAASVTKSRVNVTLPKAGGGDRKGKVRARGRLNGKRRDPVLEVEAGRHTEDGRESVDLPLAEETGAALPACLSGAPAPAPLARYRTVIYSRATKRCGLS